MSLDRFLRRTFFRRLIATPEGRAHVLALMVAAEEGDEAGVFEQLKAHADDEALRRTVERHQSDEYEHAALYRACLARNGVTPEPIPNDLLIIRQIAREAGGAFARGLDANSAHGIASREDVMNTYALLLAIEERGVEQFPLIGAEFRRIGDHETADTFDRVAKDELRHTKYCRALGRRYAPDEATWQRAVEHFRAVESRAFHRVGLAGIAYTLREGLILGGVLGRFSAKLLSVGAGSVARLHTPA
jgi:rubrerythrin